MNLRRHLHNVTPCVVDAMPRVDRHGRDVALFVAKLTLDVSFRGALRIASAPIRWRDVPFGDARGSIRYPSDEATEKLGTDVLLLGTCHPPAEGAVTMREARLRVSAGDQMIDKTLRVFGPRVWMKGLWRLVPGPPATLTSTPLIYELAYGGEHEPRNPVGIGSAEHQPTPRIEDPKAPLDAAKPAPAGFGPIAPHWQPRADYLGTCDERWQRTRAPIPPVDFDLRHASACPPDQWCESGLKGVIQVDTLGMSEREAWSFTLPRYALAVRYVARGKVISLRPHLDTLLIDAEDGRVELVWRAAIPLKRSGKLEHVYVYSDDDKNLRDAIALSSSEPWPYDPEAA